MNTFSDESLILVAVMPNTKDYEIARMLGWYRIPLKMAPKIIDVDYLAFYQTGNFGRAHRWMIESYAPVLGNELTTRAALLRDEVDHPRAHEEYYKIQIGEIKKLEPPIPAGKWKRITFLYTLGYLVNQAGIINDLVVKTEDREILWKCLRERQNSDYLGSSKHQLTLFTDEEMLLLLGQITGIAKDNDFTDV